VIDRTGETQALAVRWSLDTGRVGIDAVDDLFGSAFRVTDAAITSVALALAAVAAFDEQRTGRPQRASLDGRHAAAAFHSERLLRLCSDGDLGLWDPLAGNYPTADGWIRLHTNLPHHRDATLRTLGTAPDRAAVAAAVRRWDTGDLEREVSDAGGVAARMRTRDEYLAHPQRAAVVGRPLVDLDLELDPAGGARPRWLGDGRVLDGIRVLDLTRVIAGPVAGRFLASFGADVVRVDPPLADGLALEIETGPGKRRTTIDLRDPAGRHRFERLVSKADVLLEGFRPGALAHLGYPDRRLRELAPGLVVGHLSAYGDRGPWAARRGFDSVVQVATGLAHACGFDPATGPGRLPAQALDHASGYLLAAGVVAGLCRQQRDASISTVLVSLARTGEWLAAMGHRDRPERPLPREAVDGLLDVWRDTPWGDVEHLRPPGRVGDRPARWSRPPVPRSDADVTWLEEAG
jgi:crotonobetainyl-CoA:carnitine CoA-transferase CaiB-like acyl-CoA transferase